MKHALLTLASIGVFTLGLNSASANVAKNEVDRLGKDLTPFGAEAAGNKDGSIPAWTGGITTPPKGYKGSGTEYINPFPDDKPLFTIDGKNYKQYQDNLTEGQITMLKSASSEFAIPVYKTRRTFSAPERVVKNTRNNAVSASLADGGNGILNAYGGVPFPIPENGLEIVWNHITRWQGVTFTETNNSIEVHPDGNYQATQYNASTTYNFYDPQGNKDSLDNILFYTLTEYTWPNMLAGNLTLIHETLDQVSEPRRAWNYLPGQRRVRRAPGLAYDQSASFTIADEADMFNGAPDRFDWKLVEKKEIYVPYNSYKLSSKSLTYDQMLASRTVDPSLTRWEKHRVWVVEGTLKDGIRHVYGKRRFYVDEDSWSILISEAYDNRGELWKVNYAHTINAYDLPGFTNELVVYHDLIARKYSVDFLDNEISTTRNFGAPKPAISYWKPANLRRLGRR
ncbi:DUF1329 domain-containing protein [Endozoicomonas arenosclerae]|uniref:DUF1329 domain-containing protein n=1 Tax=Endozoicomonas arenosclerae TaxID=1633495 RepID=UPI000AFDB298|nr:DUF1329 domain-containing protein [Endozoicomonas arenosclerae]